MEHANLRRFGFLRRIGASSVDRPSRAGIRDSIESTCSLLRGSTAGVRIFPPGEDRWQRHPSARHPGRPPAARSSCRGRVRIVHVAFRYDYLLDELPEAFVKFREPKRVDASEAASGVGDWEPQLVALLDELLDDVAAQRGDRFSLLLEGRRSISERYARFRERWKRSRS
jgi:hypothetical protein